MNIRSGIIYSLLVAFFLLGIILLACVWIFPAYSNAFLISGVLSLVIGSVIALWFFRAVTRLVRHVMERASELSIDQTNYYLPDRTKNEIGILTQTFNGMMDNLDDSVKAKEQTRSLIQVLSLSGETIALAHSPEEVYRLLGQEITRLGYNMLILSLINDGTQLQTSYTTYNKDIISAVNPSVNFLKEGHSFSIKPDGIHALILNDKQTLYYKDIITLVSEAFPDLGSDLCKALVTTLKAPHAILAPLIINNKPFGLLLVMGSELEKTDVYTVSIFARQAVVGLENALLLELQRQRETEMERRMLELSALNSIATIVNESLDGKEFFNRSLDEVMRIVGVDTAGVYLLNDDGSELYAAAYRGVSDNFYQIARRFHVNDNIIGRVVLSGDPLVFNHLSEYSGSLKTPLIKEKIQSLAAFPLTGHAGLIGIICLGSKKIDYFDKNSLELIVHLGRQIAIGIEKAHLHEALYETEWRFRTLVEQIPASTYIAALDVASTRLYQSPQIENMTGFSIQEWTADGEIWCKQLHPDDSARVMEEVLSSHMNGSPFHSEYRLMTKDGVVLWVLDDAMIVRDEDGTPLYLQGVMFDITERKRVEEELRMHQERLEELVEERTVELKETNTLLEQEIKDRMRTEEDLYQSRLMLQLVLDHIPQRVYWKDISLHYLGCNKSFIDDSRHNVTSNIIGKDDFEISGKNDAEMYRKADMEVIQSKTAKINQEEMRYHTDGSQIWIRTFKLPLTDSNGNVVGVLGTYEDITERKQAEEGLRLAASVFETAAEGIMITDASGNIVSVNPAFTQVTGFTNEKVIDKNPRFLKSGRHDTEFYQQLWDTLIKTGRWQGEIWNRHMNGEIYPAWLNISSVKNDSGHVTNYVGILTDISIRKENEERLRYLATHDVLTGLPNRDLFYDRLNQAIERASRNQLKLAVMLLDLDHFKFVNDTLGHAKGDIVLQSVSKILLSRVRKCDTVARMGGDEFTLILEGVTNIKSVAALARKILKTLSEPIELDGFPYTITGSLGISLYPDDGKDTETLFKTADVAMYHAKRDRNRYFFYNEENESPHEKLMQ